jgi:hypothetical protein
VPDQFQPFEFPKQSKHSSRNKPPENKDVGWISFHEPFHFIPSNRHGNAYTRTQTLIQEIVLQKHRNVDGYNEHWTNNALMHHSFQVFDWFFFWRSYCWNENAAFWQDIHHQRLLCMPTCFTTRKTNPSHEDKFVILKLEICANSRDLKFMCHIFLLAERNRTMK